MSDPVVWRGIIRLSDDEIYRLFDIHLRENDNQPHPVIFARMLEIAIITRIINAHIAVPNQNTTTLIRAELLKLLDLLEPAQ